MATLVRNGMSSAAAVRAASATGAHGRLSQPSLPYVQIAAASNSAPHSQSAIRLKRSGAFTVGRNSHAPNVIHTVTAVAISIVRWWQNRQATQRFETSELNRRHEPLVRHIARGRMFRWPRTTGAKQRIAGWQQFS